MYYPLSKRTLVDGMHDDLLVKDDLGIRAAAVRIEMKTDKAKPYSVWALSELALWGAE